MIQHPNFVVSIEHSTFKFLESISALNIELFISIEHSSFFCQHSTLKSAVEISSFWTSNRILLKTMTRAFENVMDLNFQVLVD